MWAADHVAVAGQNFYDPNLLLAAENLIGSPAFSPFPYPPTYALLTAPLGWLSYPVALLLWTALGIALFAAVILKSTRGRGIWPIVAFPGLFIAVMNGQNGLFLASIFAAGLALLNTRQLAGGMLLGLLSIKPQLGLLIPIALLAGGYYRAFVGAALSAVALAVASIAIFGLSAWHDFFLVVHVYQDVLLEALNFAQTRITSLFATVHRMGVSTGVAYAIHITVSFAAAGCIVIAWRGSGTFRIKQAILIVACLLATPYSFDYDLALLGPAIAVAAVTGVDEGFRPWEKTVLALLWIVPVVARPITIIDVPIVPLALVLGLAVFMRRISRGASGERPALG
jgi:alpha-1,2-mannosyltransferase